MNAAGDGIDGLSCSEGDVTASKSARHLFSDHDCEPKFAPGVVARSMPALRLLRRAREHCDVVLKTVDGAELWAHSFVLSARYAGFDALFSGANASLDTGPDTEQGEHQQQDHVAWPPITEVLVTELSAEMARLIVDIAYHVPLRRRVGVHNVRGVLDVAEELNITMLRDHCLQLLKESLEPDNCIGTYHLAASREYPDLSKEAFRYLVRNFDKIWRASPQFQSLQPDELCSALHDHELHVPNEFEGAFGAIVKWIDGDPEVRRVHLPRLLPLVRFAYCDRADIERVENDPRVRASEEARNVLKAIKRTLQQEEMDVDNVGHVEHLSGRRWLRPRIPKNILFMFGGWTGGATNTLLTYNSRSGHWRLLPNQRAPPRAYHGVAMLKGRMYFVGGFDGRDCYSSVTCLDVAKRKWIPKSNMHVARCYVSVAALEGHIYAMGGFDGEGRTSSSERYDPKRNQWKFVASMNQVRSDACAAAACGRIFVLGGFTGQEVLDSVECYDPSTDQWTRVLNMVRPRSGFQAVVDGDMVYVMGGFDGTQRLDSAERLDVSRGRWTELPSMTFQRSNFVAVILEGNIYVAGGFNGATTVSLVERYDVEARQWHHAPSLSITCSAAAACVYLDVPDPRRWL